MNREEPGEPGKPSGDEETDEITPTPGVTTRSPASARHPRRGILGTLAIAILSVGAAVGSILGQGISYRQMRAIESIADSLTRATGGCAR